MKHDKPNCVYIYKVHTQKTFQFSFLFFLYLNLSMTLNIQVFLHLRSCVATGAVYVDRIRMGKLFILESASCRL